MSQNVADLLWEMLANAGVKRCYGIVGDALNPVIEGCAATTESISSTSAMKSAVCWANGGRHRIDSNR